MRERWVRPTHTIYDLTERKPLLVKVLEKDPVLNESIKKLQGSGLQLQRLQKTPYEIRDKLHPDDKAVMILNQALDVRTDDEAPEIQPVREIINSALLFTAPGPLTESKQTAIDRLNEAIQPRRERIARRRLLSDRPKKELKDLSWTGAFTATALIAANLLEKFGFKGPGLFAAQSLDDVGNTVAMAKTEKGGGKKFGQIARENWMVVPILGAAAVADTFWLPSLLESPNLGLRVLGGALFSTAAVSGSVTSMGRNILNSIPKKNERKQRNMTFLEGVNEGWKLNGAHPFRKFMRGGIVISEIATVTASAMSVLLKDPTLQTFLGQLETIAAYSGLFLGSAAGAGLDNIKDLWTIRKTKKS